MTDSDPTFFPTPEDFRTWLHTHHKTQTELWVGFYKKATGIATITWSESVDQALCYGWIDGIRKKVDDKSYKIRFTPRRVNSHWSAVNLAKMKELEKKGLLQAAGIAIFEKRKVAKEKRYSYEENNITELSPVFIKELKTNEKAWAFYDNLAPSDKKATIHWVMSAKKEETRLRRFKTLVESSEQGLKIPPIRRSK